MSTTRTTAGTKSASDAQQKILTALRELGIASAQQVSEHAKLAYSTTTAKLRSLETAGLARRERHPDGATIWQPADAVAAGTTAEEPAPDTTTTKTGIPDTGKSKPSSKRIRQSGARPKDQPAPDEPAAPADAGPDRTRSDADTDSAGAGDGDGKRARRAKGALRAEALAVLQDHPDTAFKVSQVCRHLPGASAGAIANALDKLVADGTAKQIADKPATYQAE